MKLYCLEKQGVVSREVEEPSFSSACEVLVVGVGAAGSHAAIAAAREGARVIALEREENIGGMPVNGFVGSYYYGADGGSYEMLDAAAAEKKQIFWSGAMGPDMRRLVLVEELDKYGVELRCGCVFDGVYMEGERVVGLRTFRRGVCESIRAEIVIDATSDGHVIHMCPVKTEHGRPSDGKSAPFTIRPEVYHAEKGRQCDNSDSGEGNPYLVEDFSRRIVVARGAKTRMIGEGKQLISLSSVCGIREGLRFEGEERFTYEDLVLGKEWERVLFYAYSDLDKHGSDRALDEELFQNWWCISNLATVAMSIPVPMGAVVPRGLSGIVTAGRCMSVDSYASSAVRMNRDMFRMGECVGIGAALSVKEGCGLLSLDYDTYLAKVREYRCFDGEGKGRFGFHFPKKDKGYVPVDPNMGADAILAALATERPGAAVWASYRTGDASLAARLIEAMASESELLKNNAAIALGIMGRREGLPLLRELVRRRSNFYFKDCRRSNQFPGVIAICLLGRLGEAEDIPLLAEIIFSDREFENPIYDLAPDYLYCGLKNTRNVLYQYYTHATASYIKLAKRFGVDAYTPLAARFSEREREKIVCAITTLPKTAHIHSAIRGFMDCALELAK